MAGANSQCRITPACFSFLMKLPRMMLSVTWAVYATVLIVVGLWKRYAPIRYFAMTVFVITIVKVFAIDLAELDRIYRVLSVVGLGVMAAYALARLKVPGEKHLALWITLDATNGLDRFQIGRARVPFGEGVTGRVAATREPIAIPDVSLDQRFLWVRGIDQRRAPRRHPTCDQ